jgi:hypothetical protein
MTTFLFTTLPTNDLGLLTRSLPIASELAKQGHTIYDLMTGDQNFQLQE